MRLTRQPTMRLAYGDRRSEPNGNAINLHLLKLRRVLAPHGITIVTHYGAGFSISAEGKAKLRALIGQGRAETA